MVQAPAGASDGGSIAGESPAPPPRPTSELPAAQIGAAPMSKTETIGPSFDQVDDLFGDPHLDSADQSVPNAPSPSASPSATSDPVTTSPETPAPGIGNSTTSATGSEHPAVDPGSTGSAMDSDPQPSGVNQESSHAAAETLSPGYGWLSPSFRVWKTWILVAGSVAMGVIATVGILQLSDRDHRAKPGEVVTPLADEGMNAESDRSSHGDASDEDDGLDTGLATASPPNASHDENATPVPSVTDDESSSTAEQGGNDTTNVADDQAPKLGSNPRDRMVDPAGTSTTEERPAVFGTPSGPPSPVASEHESDSNQSPLSGVASASPPITIETRYKPALPPLNPVDVTAQLAGAIRSLRLREMSLVEFLRVVSEFSTIPITLEPESLQLVGVSAADTISVDMENTTVGDVLEAALAPKKLAYEVSDRQLIVRSVYSIGNSMHRWDHSVADLIEGEPQEAEALVGYIQQLVAPESWQSRGGAGTVQIETDKLVIVQTAESLYQVHVLCEKLRMARGHAIRSRRNPERFRLDTRAARARACLETQVQLNFPRSTPWRDIIRQWEETTGATLLVDWRAVSELGWTPAAEVTVRAGQLSLEEALRGLLTPMHLTYRAIDENTLQITTPAAVNAQPELEFYAAGDLTDRRAASGVSGEHLAQRVWRTLKDQGFEEIGGIAFDEKCQCLMVLAPQPHQRAVAEMLAQWR